MISAHFGKMAKIGEIDLPNHVKTLGYSNISALGREMSVFRSFPHFYVNSQKHTISQKTSKLAKFNEI